MTWWGLVLGGVLLFGVGVAAILAYSYWGWRGRIEGAAVVSPFLGLFFILWGIGRGARVAARRIAGQVRERRTGTRAS